jgi:hypothetical protein
MIMEYINHIMEVYACLLGLEPALYTFRAWAGILQTPTNCLLTGVLMRTP